MRRHAAALAALPLNFTAILFLGHRCSFEYLVLDDCWAEKERPADGRLIGNKRTFPSGMKVGGRVGRAVASPLPGLRQSCRQRWR